MRKLTLALLFTLVALPTFAQSSGRSHSYFTYDDGGTIIRQGEDGREIEARVNLPLFPGDEVTTSRRGRAEIRLADGNIIALDRSTTIRLRSILDSYDGDNAQTVVELRAGHVALQRDDDTHQLLRLDTNGASYAATDSAIYAVEFDPRGYDRVTVFDGWIEARTPSRTTRIRDGEEAHIDDQGIYDLTANRGAADDFERWFLRRSERYRTAQSRYLDRSLAYYDEELSANGSWLYVNTYNSWVWRPRVAVGWRPYYYGAWHRGPSGCLIWASYEPWGWVPYHYGRWAYDSFYGWVWLPGLSYAPAWVYWMYGPSYVGWAPMGWYDCYRPYYNWAYRPYSRVSFGFDYGWYGRVHVGNIDLRPWTFVSPNGLVSRRVDQAAVSTDIVRERLLRGGEGGFATVSSAPARFSRNEIKDPTAAVGVIARRGIGSGTGKEGSGVATVADMTPFFRRDPELSTSIRERVARTYRSDTSLAFPSGSVSGVPAPGTAGTVEGGIGRDNGGRVRSEVGQGGGGVVNRGGAVNGTGGGTIGGWRGNETPSNQQTPSPTERNGSGTIGTIRRGEAERREETPSASAPSTSNESVSRGDWRERVVRPTPPPEQQQPATVPPPAPSNQDWRGRTIGRRGGSESSGGGSSSSNGSGGTIGSIAPGSGSSSSERGSSEVPRRIIDSIGGSRIYSGDRDRGSRDSGSSRDSGGSRRDSGGSRESSSSRGGGNSNSGGGHVERSSPPPQEQHSSPPPSHSSESTGRIKRD